MRTFPCPCCAYPTLHEQPPGTFEICEVCGSEDDNVQFRDPTYRGGANQASLLEARVSFAAIGASSPECAARVRPPTEQERRNRAVSAG